MPWSSGLSTKAEVTYSNSGNTEWDSVTQMTKLHDSLKDVRLHSDGILGSTLPRFGLSYSHQGGCHNNWTVKYMFTMQKLNECEYQSVWTWKPFNHLNLRYSKTATMSSALTNAQI